MVSNLVENGLKNSDALDGEDSILWSETRRSFDKINNNEERKYSTDSESRQNPNLSEAHR